MRLSARPRNPRDADPCPFPAFDRVRRVARAAGRRRVRRRAQGGAAQDRLHADAGPDRRQLQGRDRRRRQARRRDAARPFGAHLQDGGRAAGERRRRPERQPGRADLPVQRRLRQGRSRRLRALQHRGERLPRRAERAARPVRRAERRRQEQHGPRPRAEEAAGDGADRRKARHCRRSSASASSTSPSRSPTSRTRSRPTCPTTRRRSRSPRNRPPA
jgi:hypothetical protein